MAQRILFPEALKHVIAILATKVAVPVVGGSPEDGTLSYIRVRRTGGVQVSKVMEIAQFTVDVYAPADDLVEPLSQDTRSHCKALPGTHLPGFTCTRFTEYSGPREAWDPEVPTLARWRFTFAIHLKGTTTS